MWKKQMKELKYSIISCLSDNYLLVHGTWLIPTGFWALVHFKVVQVRNCLYPQCRTWHASIQNSILALFLNGSFSNKFYSNQERLGHCPIYAEYFGRPSCILRKFLKLVPHFFFLFYYQKTKNVSFVTFFNVFLRLYLVHKDISYLHTKFHDPRPQGTRVMNF